MSSSRSGRQSSVRKEMERRSAYARLLHETDQYQKTVAELEQVLPEAGEHPEASWRAKILMRSAQDMDQELWTKLYDYEKTLHNRERDPEVRQQQTACMKLHRDFKRSHRSLVMAVTLYEKTQRAEMAQLGAVGWSGRQEGDEEEDFYTRTMRERQEELERMNYSMHQVGNLYTDLSFLIQKQQEPIDEMEEMVEDAHATTRAAPTRSFWDNLDHLCQPERDFSVRDGKWKVDGEDVVFAVPNCRSMAMEVFQDTLPSAVMPSSDKNKASVPSSSRTTSSVSSFITDSSSEGSPRGVMGSPVAFSEEAPASDLRSPADDYRVSEEFHWMMPFETLATDMKAVQSDIVHFGTELTSEVMAQTKRVADPPQGR